MSARSLTAEELPDPLPLATAATAIAALFGVRWAAFDPVTATLAALAFVALGWRWMDAPRAARRPGPLLTYAGCALLAGAIYVVRSEAALAPWLAIPTALAALYGRPRRSTLGGGPP
ncbi:MAG TPA: hypothetical protein VGU43_06545 [Thermoplasmata archaeon]|nr:hypothetical protein [Thermoplasmata archaeon]